MKMESEKIKIESKFQTNAMDTNQTYSPICNNCIGTILQANFSKQKLPHL